MGYLLLYYHVIAIHTTTYFSTYFEYPIYLIIY